MFLYFFLLLFFFPFSRIFVLSFFSSFSFFFWQTHPTPRSRPAKASTTPSKLVTFLAEQAIHGERSAHKGRAPPEMTTTPPTIPDLSSPDTNSGLPAETAKSVLDAKGPEAMAAWVRQKKGVMITDTTMRDAHQVCFLC